MVPMAISSLLAENTFWYKWRCLNTPTGYLVTFDVYQSKNSRSNEGNVKKFWEAAGILVQIIDDYI